MRPTLVTWRRLSDPELRRDALPRSPGRDVFGVRGGSCRGDVGRAVHGGNTRALRAGRARGASGIRGEPVVRISRRSRDGSSAGERRRRGRVRSAGQRSGVGTAPGRARASLCVVLGCRRLRLPGSDHLPADRVLLERLLLRPGSEGAFRLNCWRRAWAAVLLVGAILAADRMPFAGALFVATLAAYAAGRFFIDFGRDAPRKLGGLTVAQAWSAGFVLLSVTFLAVASWVV